MSKNEIAKISQDNSLVNVSNLISLTNKLLNEISSKGIVLYNISEYNLQRETEIAFISLINKNIWLFIPEIIEQIKSNKLSSNQYPLDFIKDIKKNDLTYEYPRSFYRRRGNGTNLVDKEYDKKINESNEKYIWCSPPMDSAFKSMACANITCYIAGAIITEFADTSIGLVLGLKYRWTYNDREKNGL